MRLIATLATVAVLATVATARATTQRVLFAEVEVPAPVADVWAAWTTAEGIRSFFAPAGNVDLRIDGVYNVWFAPDAPAGMRGADDMRILDVDPNRRFAFTWNAPPSVPEIRPRRTMVVVEFEPRGNAKTLVRFTHMGWGAGPEWDKAYDYLDMAWNGMELPFLVYRFEKGPVDWAAPPAVKPVVKSMKVNLEAPTP